MIARGDGFIYVFGANPIWNLDATHFSSSYFPALAGISARKPHTEESPPLPSRQQHSAAAAVGIRWGSLSNLFGVFFGDYRVPGI